MRIKEVIDEILCTVTPFKRKSTQLKHKIFLKELKREIGKFSLESFTRKEYIKWIEKFKVRRSERKTFNDYTKFINIIFNYAHQNQHIEYIIKFPKTDPEKGKVGRIYTNAELIKIWACTEGTMKLQFALAYECFMRVSEGLHLTWARVDLEKKLIILRKEDVKTGTKTGHGRLVPMSDLVFELLSKMRPEATTDWVFPNPLKNGPCNVNRRAWMTIKKRAGIKGRARWHDIRHTAITTATLGKNVPTAHLSKVAGVSIATLEAVYLHEQIEHVRFVTQALKIKEIA